MKKFLFAFLLLTLSSSLPLILTITGEDSISRISAGLSQAQTTTLPLMTEESTEEVSLANDENVKEALLDIETHWAKTYINDLFNMGAVSGYEDGNFGPDEKITRAEIIKIALLAFKHPAGMSDYAINPFTDVQGADWYYDYIMDANALDIASGYTNGSFKPNKEVSRAEALKIILVAGGVKDYSSVVPNFSDVDTVTDWFSKYTAYAKLAGLISGYEDGSFRGNQSITRGEVCKIVVNLMKSLESI